MEIIKRNPKAFMMAVAMHLVLIFFLVVGVDWLEDPKVGRPPVNVIQAKVISEDKVAAEAQQIKQEQEKEKAKKQAEKTKAEQELSELKKKQEAERLHLADLEKKRKEEAKTKAEAEKKELAELEQKRKKAEEDKKTEKRRQAELDRKLREEEIRRQHEQELQNSLAAEQNARSAEQNDRAFNAFGAAVEDLVTRNWLRPPGTGTGLKCTLQVRVSTTGTVLGVQVVQGSGNEAFDRSAEAAVVKSDPFPPPPPGLNDIDFIFDPDNQ